MKKTDYNERLFDSKFENFFHESRYLWVKRKVLKNSTPSNLRLIELGCLDSRLLKYFPPESIDYYYGIDSGWFDYTKRAIEKYKNDEHIEFLISPELADISPKKADMLVAMQVFEYIPEKKYNAYFERFSDAGCSNFYITCSNERGIFMIGKILIKKILRKDVAAYSLKDIWHLVINRMDKIERTTDSMKGFDYRKLIDGIGSDFEIDEVVGLPFTKFPVALNFTVAIHAKRRSVD